MDKYSRIEELTLSVEVTDLNIMKYFISYIGRLENRMKWGNKIQYIGVQVSAPNNNHIHLFWKKPYFQMSELRELWIKVTGKNTHVKNLTLFSKKKVLLDEDEQKIIEYYADQSIHHVDYLKRVSPVVFFKSDHWGESQPREKKGDKTQYVQYEESYCIPDPLTGKLMFVHREVFEEYMNIQNGKHNISKFEGDTK